MRKIYANTLSKLAIIALIPLLISAVLFSSIPYQGRTAKANQLSAQATDAVTTQPATAITQGLANFNGDITDSGSTITRKGFEWGIDTSYGNDLGAPGTFSTGTYSYQVSGLNCGTTYHFRAYFVNSSGTFYGGDQEFSTVACSVPIVSTNGPGQGNAFTNTPNLLSRGFQWGTTQGLENTTLASGSAPYAAAYSGQFGSEGYSPGQLTGPWGIAIDQFQNIYVTSAAGKISKYNGAGVFIKSFGTYGSGYGKIAVPTGVAISSDNKIYVADAYNNKIAIFDSEGVFQNEFGTTGSGSGQFKSPLALTFDATGNIYVADTGNSRIEIFYPSLNYKSEFGSEGDQPNQLNFPTDIKLNSVGNLVIGDSYNNRIQIFTTTGEPVGRFGTYGDGPGQFSGLLSVAIDAEDNIFVSDQDNNWVQKFSSSGSFLGYFGQYGSGDGQFSEPTNMSFGADGKILVVDLGNHRAQYFIIGDSFTGGAFQVSFGSFNPCTNYYFRAFVANPFGAYYGDTTYLNTGNCPIVLTPEQAQLLIAGRNISQQAPAEPTVASPNSAISQGTYIQPESKPNNIIERLASLLKSVPPNIAITIPYLLISLLLILAILYALQSYREYLAIKRYKNLKNQFVNLQNANQNFIMLTNHYLNTPIGILQLSSEALVTAGIINSSLSREVSDILDSVKNKINELLKNNEQTNVESAKELQQINLEKGSSTSFSAKAWGLIIIAGVLVILANYLFINAKTFSADINSFGIQAALFVMGTIFILFAYQSMRINRRNKQRQSDILKANQVLMDKKMNFISNTSKSIKGEINKLEDISNGLEINDKTKPFIKGVSMLAGIEKSFELLQKFSVVSPFESIGSNESNEVFEEIIKRQKDTIDAKRLKLSLNLPDDMNMGLSKSALILLLGSTISNAIKFSKNEGKVEVSAKTGNKSTTIKITDNGIGIAKDKIDYLMQPFSRATDVMQYDYEGMGLGLYLDRIIMEQIGGSISIKSELEKGTTIKIEIPKGKKAKNRPSKANINGPALARQT